MKVAKVLLGKNGGFRPKEASDSGDWKCGTERAEKPNEHIARVRWRNGNNESVLRVGKCERNLNGQHNDFP